MALMQSKLKNNIAVQAQIIRWRSVPDNSDSSCGIYHCIAKSSLNGNRLAHSMDPDVYISGMNKTLNRVEIQQLIIRMQFWGLKGSGASNAAPPLQVNGDKPL